MNSSSTPIQPGHLGLPRLHPQTRQWTFGRELADYAAALAAGPPLVRLLQEQAAAFEHPAAPARSDGSANPFRKAVWAPHQKTDAIVNALPALQPAVGQLEAEARLSHALTSLTFLADPTVASRLQLGHLGLPVRGRSIRIALYTNGANHDTICLHEIAEETQAWTASSAVQVAVPRATEAIGRICTGGPPVRQLLLSSKRYSRHMIFAARLPHQTSFVYPRISDRLVPARDLAGNVCGQYPRSRFELLPVVAISSLQTGRSAHADVAFNGFRSDEVAVVTETLRWYVYRISRRRDPTVPLRLSPLADGSVGVNGRQTVEEDGWARLSWVGSADTLFVCSRTRAVLCDTRAPDSPPVQVELGLDGRQNAVLDIAAHPADPGQLLVLTSRQLFILAVEPAESGPVVATTLFAWQHGRSIGDTSLKIGCFQSGPALYVSLHSRRFGTGTLNRLVQPRPAGARYVLAHSIHLPLCRSDATIDNLSVPIEVTILPCEWIEKTKASVKKRGKEEVAASASEEEPPDPGADLKRSGALLLAQFLSFRQGSPVLQILSLSTRDVQVQLPAFRFSRRRPSRFSCSGLPAAGPRGFVADSDEDSSDREPRSVNKKIQVPTFLGFTNLYQLVQLFDVQAGGRVEEISSLIPAWKDSMVRRYQVQNRYCTIFELANIQAYVGDIDSDTVQVSELLGLLSERIGQDLFPSILLSLPGIRREEVNSLSSLHDFLCRTWLGSLDPNVSSHHDRISRERGLRDFTLTLYLASTVPNQISTGLWRGAILASPLLAGVAGGADAGGDGSDEQEEALDQPDPSHICSSMGRLRELSERRKRTARPSWSPGQGSPYQPLAALTPATAASDADMDEPEPHPSGLPTVSLKDGHDAGRTAAAASFPAVVGGRLPKRACEKPAGECELQTSFTQTQLGALHSIGSTWTIDHTHTDSRVPTERILAAFWKRAQDLVRHRETQAGPTSPRSARRELKKQLRRQRKLERQQDMQARLQGRQKPATPLPGPDAADPFSGPAPSSSSVQPGPGAAGLFSSVSQAPASSQQPLPPASTQLTPARPGGVLSGSFPGASQPFSGSSQLFPRSSQPFPRSSQPKRRPKRKEGF